MAALPNKTVWDIPTLLNKKHCSMAYAWMPNLERDLFIENYFWEQRRILREKQKEDLIRESAHFPATVMRLIMDYRSEWGKEGVSSGTAFLFFNISL